MSDAPCVCGHIQYDHIYEEGACRPGFVCAAGCTRFRLDDGQLTIDDALDDLGRVIPSRASDPETSHAAAREVRVKAGSQRARLLQAFMDSHECESGDFWTFSIYGLTDEEAMQTAEGVSPTSEYSKRCSELREGGFIEPTGETRLGGSGKARIVSRITPKGAAWIRENR